MPIPSLRELTGQPPPLPPAVWNAVTEDRLTFRSVLHALTPPLGGHCPQFVPARLQLPESIREHGHRPHLLFNPDQFAGRVVPLIQPIRVDQPESRVARRLLDRVKEI